MGHELVPVTAAVPPPPPPPPPPPAPSTTSLAPGFRFHPTDEELVTYYLRRKASGKPFRFQAVSEIDVYKSEPWQLSEFSLLKTRDLEWYFFSPVDRKYGNGSRLNRATGKGYWKATGKDRPVRHQSQVIGMKKTLVFHSGRAPDGKRTNWVMHEYRLVDDELEKAGVPQEKDAFVLCRIFQKSGLGPPNGDRYAPFVEEEWVNDSTMMLPGGETEDETANGEETRVGGTDTDQDNISPLAIEAPASHNFAIICKRERSEEEEDQNDPGPLSLSQTTKRSKRDDPSSSHANGSHGSEDSITTSHEPVPITTMMTSSSLLAFPLLDPVEPKEQQTPMFDSSNLEKSVPPGYLKFISNLENEILNVSMERETLKIEVMRAQAMINILQSRMDLVSKENEDLRRHVRGG